MSPAAPGRATPASLGYRMPAEWEPHRATWIAWPHEASDWVSKLPAVHWVYAEIVRQLASGERVEILVRDDAEEALARSFLEPAMVDLQRLGFHHVPTDRSWLRDSGPIFVCHPVRGLLALDWHFNAWAKYDNFRRDRDVPRGIAASRGVACQEAVFEVGRARRPLVLEGGSIDVNGEGLLLTTEECLLSRAQARNPGLSRSDMERALGEHLRVERVIWLGRGIAGDDTHGHVDDLARFVGPRTVAAALEEDPADANHAALRDNLERLRAARDLTGRPLEVVELPMPRPLFYDGERLPASYLNFYISNDKVLVPTFNDPADRHALNALAALFPGRTVVGIHAVDLVLGLGTLHCLTQQEPRAPA